MRKLMLVLAAAGFLVVAPAAHAGEEIPFEQLPDPVKATVVREVSGGQIKDIERDTKKGQPIFEIEFIHNGVEYEIDVALDGTLLKRSVD